MKRLIKLGMVLAIAALASAGVPASAVEWDFATANAPASYQTKLAERFVAEVATATHNEVKIVIHAGGQLGFKGPEMLGVIRDGLVPIGSFQFAQQAGLSRLLGVPSIAYLVSGFDEMNDFRIISKPYFDVEFKRFNQKLLYTVPWPGQNIFSQAELSSLNTFRTMKIRTIDRAGSDFFRSLGASPSQIPWGEVVPALATGVIDSVSTSTSSAVDGQFWEFVKVCNVVNWQSNFDVVSVNLDDWNKLSLENRKLIEGIAERLEPIFWEAAKAEDSKNFQMLKAKGMEIYVPAAHVRDGMAEKGKQTWAVFQQSVPAAKPLVANYLSAVGK